jgi:mannose-6-phosphate isomerase-like protein (cupin superfamily)
MRGLVIGFCGILMLGVWQVSLFGQAAGGAAPAPAPPAATDKAQYWDNADIQNIWKDLEARNVINKRIMEGGSYSLNVRTVRETDRPLVHHNSIDLWIVQAGTATAVTGGELVDAKPSGGTGSNADDIAGTSIKGGIEQPVKAGDIVYVPTGVPHGFKNIKGFRAFLVRWEIKAPGVGAK